jgi:c-di-GMP-related signal transduction protein
MYVLARGMIPSQNPGLVAVNAEALLRLELLLGERAVTLSAISDIVNQNAGLKIHVLQLAHDTAPHDDGDEVSLDQCIVEIGIERLRESIRETRFRLKAN